MLYVAIVLGIVLHIEPRPPTAHQIFIAQLFRERRSLAFSILSGRHPCHAPIIGWIIVTWAAHGDHVRGRGLGAVGAPIAYAIYRHRAARKGRNTWASQHGGATTRTASGALGITLKVVLRMRRSGFSRWPWRCDTWCCKRRVGAFRDSARRPRLEHGGGQHAARCLGVYRRAVALGGRLGDLVDKRKLIMLSSLALEASVAFMACPVKPCC